MFFFNIKAIKRRFAKKEGGKSALRIAALYRSELGGDFSPPAVEAYGKTKSPKQSGRMQFCLSTRIFAPPAVETYGKVKNPQ